MFSRTDNGTDKVKILMLFVTFVAATLGRRFWELGRSFLSKDFLFQEGTSGEDSWCHDILRQSYSFVTNRLIGYREGNVESRKLEKSRLEFSVDAL